MTRSKWRIRVLLLALACGLSSCGLYVPDIKEVWDRDIPGDPSIKKPEQTGTMQIEFEIRRKIYCELRTAVVDVNKIPLTVYNSSNKPVGTRAMIPSDWIAQMSLSLEVDESSALSPGVTFNQVMANAITTFGVGRAATTVTTPQSFNLGFGGTLSSTATRTDKFDPTYSIGWLMQPNTRLDICRPENDIFYAQNIVPAQSSPLILSDLGIKKWLLGAMLTENLLPSHPPIPQPQPPTKQKCCCCKGAMAVRVAALGGDAGGNASGGGGGGGGGSLGPFSVSVEIKFIIISSGNVTPTWKLVNISANTGSTPLFSAGRTRTHDLIITVGPANQQTQNSNLALQIGNSVSNANRAALTVPTPLLAAPF